MSTDEQNRYLERIFKKKFTQRNDISQQKIGKKGGKKKIKLTPAEQHFKNSKALNIMKQKMEILVIKDNIKQIDQTEEEMQFY